MMLAMLQMFGFARGAPNEGKPLEPHASKATATRLEAGITSGNSRTGGAPVRATASSPRRPVVKASAKKVTAAKKPASKPVAAKSSAVAQAKLVKKAAAPAKPPPPAKAAAKKTAAKTAPAKVAKVAPAKAAPAKASKPTPAKAVKPTAKRPVQASAPAADKLKKSAQTAAPAPVKPAAKAPVAAKPAAKPSKPAIAAAAPMPTEKSTPLTSSPVPADSTAAPKPAKTRTSKMTGNNAPAAPVTPVVASTAAKASYTMPSAYAPLPPVSAPHPMPVKKDPKLANNWKSKSAEELQDAEVLAMPDAEYMNDKQMAFFRLKLVGLKRDILANAGETTEHLREETVVVPDPADRATIEEEHALELRTRDRERKLLKKIEQSIARIDAGDYGYCDETGEAIGVGRLIARPTATLSLEAQQRRELKQKMFGD